jgi:iron complex outermembrane receptor protein
MVVKKDLIAGLLVLVSLIARADITDTLIYLDKVIVRELKFNEYSPGSKVYSIDTLTLKTFGTGSLADILQLENSISVRTYGPGGLSSVSIRGGSSRHTAVIWNGFSLKNPMSGGMNFSSLPAGFIDEIVVQPGGSSTMYGSGSASGVIFLSNSLDLNGDGLHLGLNSEFGSFGSFNNLLSIAYSGKKVSSRLKAGYQHADNDFKFKNQEKFGKPTDTMRHAAYRRYSLLHQSSFKLGQRSVLETDLWYTDYYKKIPSLISDYEPGSAEQEDENIRMSFNFSTYGNKWFIKYRSGLLTDNIRYNDTVNMEIHNRNTSLSLINEMESKYSFNRQNILFLGIDHTFENAESGNYITTTSRNRISFFGRYHISFVKEKIDVSVEARKEYIDHEFVPFVFSVGTDFCLFSGFHLKGVTSKHYALPAFDDLYWSEDAFSRGNPDLAPEYGWNNEAGFLYRIKKDRIFVSHELSFFRNRIHSLIIWLPGVDGKWTPENVNESLSTGIEVRGNITREFHSSEFNLRYMYSFTHATIWEEGSEISMGTARIYVPAHLASLSAGYRTGRFDVRYMQTFTGKRYYDNSHTLAPYTIGDVYMSYEWKYKKICLLTYFKIMNLYNASYQIMMGYAQPPRNYALGINISFK